MTNEIVLYQPNEQMSLEVKLENETVWLNRQQLSILFDRDVKTIGKHIRNVFNEGELEEQSTCAKFAHMGHDGLQQYSTCAKIAQVQKEGQRTVRRSIPYFNLDMIISVGYRVNSKRGVKFRQWANQV